MGSVLARRRTVEGAEQQRQVLVWEARPRRVLRRKGVSSGAEVPWEKAEDGVDPLVLLYPLILMVTG